MTSRFDKPAALSRRQMVLGAAQALVGGAAAVGSGRAAAAAIECAAGDPRNKATPARLTTVATFPPRYFLESVAVRKDHSFLVTVLNTKELWYVPPSVADRLATPIRLHTFQQLAMGIVETEPDIFYIIAANIYANPSAANLQRVDLRDWTPGRPIEPRPALAFPKEARAPNGLCLVGPGVLLVADSFAGLIWRVDLGVAGGTPSARVWLAHDSMRHFPGKMKPEQPGVNAVRYAATSRHLYYTVTAKKLLMRVSVDPRTIDPVGEPEVVAVGRMGDDFILDEASGVIYLTTHRQNTIDIVSMDPGNNSGFPQIVAGDPTTVELVGPSSGAWGRAAGDASRVAYFVTDGGTASPLSTGFEPARLLRVELAPVTGPFPGVAT